jgi:prepilin-type N-terminal cleavage/methylation domain-containing protein
MGRGETVTRDDGFTLLELIVTLAVIAVVVGLTVPTIGRSTEAIRVRADVAGFGALLRHAREQAITTRRPQAVVVDPAARRLTLVAGGPDGEARQSRTLSERLSVEANPPAALVVRFEPQGGSSGGDFRLSAGSITYRLTVDALTGRVRSVRE